MAAKKELPPDQKAIAELSDQIAHEFMTLCGETMRRIPVETVSNFNNVKHSAIFSALVKTSGSYLMAADITPELFISAMAEYMSQRPFGVDVKFDS